MNAIGIPFDYMQNSNFYPAQTVTAGTENDSYLWERGLISYMARLTYSYDGRVSATASTSSATPISRSPVQVSSPVRRGLSSRSARSR